VLGIAFNPPQERRAFDAEGRLNERERDDLLCRLAYLTSNPSRPR
jgi:hypothetical protein